MVVDCVVVWVWCSLLFIIVIVDGLKYIDMMLIWVKFEELCLDLLDRCKIFVENVLRDVKLLYKDLNEVILVGGLMRILVV